MKAERSARGMKPGTRGRSKEGTIIRMIKLNEIK
jgi:hypothetical protein